ncbi:DUF488 domain-containing protein [Brumimicrobium glaciale]|uniref:DUF488 domain-containing protein n=1 Tax=Brumimicrobium glaciale TaxID=200475 RepID=A0A4Q4KRF4_9FLAO|nr:DUF488 domain-containing protein [Brumimicrobium glaciale]RYM36126.1 DUF488 domain-containing protein [Brumimicrobium glaciale]
MNQEIWTIGHSTHSLEKFFSMLKSFNIDVLVDVRRHPGSKRYPHFNKDEFENSLKEKGFEYLHLESLGGRRKVQPDSQNTAWRLESFQGYADYLETEEFKIVIDKLKALAKNKKVTIMCAEAVWWSCHRSLLSDYLKCDGWTVLHIMEIDKGTEHPYTKPAKIINGKLDYSL